MRPDGEGGSPEPLTLSTKHPIPNKIVLETGELTAYAVHAKPPKLAKAVPQRKWMEQANKKFPYRCLPLAIANSIGWDVINPATFIVKWTGGSTPQDVQIQWPSKHKSNMPHGHFGEAVLTFTMGHLFHTPPGINLMVMGPPNEPKDGIMPCMGIVETDWCPATFTMNWILTRPNHPVTFVAGESICRIVPVPRHLTEMLVPTLRYVDDNPELAAHYQKWRESRGAFNKALRTPSAATARGWQKDYYLGGGELWPGEGPPDHQTHIRQREFEDRRSEKHQGDALPIRDLKPVNLTPSGPAIWLEARSAHIQDEVEQHAKQTRVDAGDANADGGGG